MIRSRATESKNIQRKRPPPVPAKKKSCTPDRSGSDNVKDLKTTFTLLDVDKDGRVNADDIRDALLSLGYDVSGKCVSQLIRETADGKQYLNEAEFVSMVDRVTQASDISVLKCAFEALDRDKDGYISEDDLREGLRLVGENISVEMVGIMIDVADRENIGLIGYNDFLRIMGVDDI